MRTNFLKIAGLPLAAFVLASAGAISTNASDESKVTAPPMIGFIHDPLASSCREVNVTCNTSIGPDCTYTQGSTVWQVFYKLNTTSPCVLPLHRDL